MSVYRKGNNLHISEGFELNEFDCKGKECCSITYLDDGFINKLELLSEVIGDIDIIKGYECEKTSKRKDSLHILGKAADIKHRYLGSDEVCREAEKCGFSGIIKKDERTVHLDTRQGCKFFYDETKRMSVRSWQ